MARGRSLPLPLWEPMFSSPESAKLEAERRVERVTSEVTYIRSSPPLRLRLARFFYTLAGWLEPDLTRREDRKTAG